MKNNNRIFIAFVIILLLIWFFTGNDIFKKRFVNFNNAAIAGKLTYVGSDQGLADIIVSNQEFKFDPFFRDNDLDFRI